MAEQVNRVVQIFNGGLFVGAMFKQNLDHSHLEVIIWQVNTLMDGPKNFLLTKYDFLSDYSNIALQILCGQKSCYVMTSQIQYHRSLDTRIYKTNIQFWAVLGSRGCREKIQTATFEVSFTMFSWPKILFNVFLKYCSIRTKKLHSIKVRKN